MSAINVLKIFYLHLYIIILYAINIKMYTKHARLYGNMSLFFDFFFFYVNDIYRIILNKLHILIHDHILNEIIK